MNEKRKRWWRRGAGRRLNRLKREAYAKDATRFRVWAKRYRDANTEKESARNRAYYLAHQEQAKARQRAYYWTHREQELARKRKKAA